MAKPLSNGGEVDKVAFRYIALQKYGSSHTGRDDVGVDACDCLGARGLDDIQHDPYLLNKLTGITGLVAQLVIAVEGIANEVRAPNPTVRFQLCPGAPQAFAHIAASPRRTVPSKATLVRTPTVIEAGSMPVMTALDCLLKQPTDVLPLH
eukprot:CAMPEP_0115539458 /NCGR_PEP_ID=MMETSP0271-20121206/89419_1 /TAXON_ID=71861 /ORGANISM="Scrippsiella trochoidea, Strain CCMP3099" /LENGTH=149 /DNA_ID=CAMNT_0002972415 /DNA_START=460 /DNA_END=911 /DNA_ORIENTATION=+